MHIAACQLESDNLERSVLRLTRERDKETNGQIQGELEAMWLDHLVYRCSSWRAEHKKCSSCVVMVFLPRQMNSTLWQIQSNRSPVIAPSWSRTPRSSDLSLGELNSRRSCVSLTIEASVQELENLPMARYAEWSCPQYGNPPPFKL